MMDAIIKQIGLLVINPESQKWCQLPYPGHPNGCPNYGRKKGCPPGHPLIYEIFDIEKPLYLVAVKFDLEKRADELKEKHPDWTERQCRNIRYWQPQARKRLKEETGKIIREGKFGDLAEFDPEAAGIDMTATCRSAGLELKWPPEKYAYKIAIVGQAIKR